jgi:glycosyltransferase involved in cell wall biosynthesis
MLLPTSGHASTVQGICCGRRGASFVRILVLNQYFRPDQSASAQRISDLTEDLAVHHEVTVLAGRPSYGPMETLPRDARVSDSGVRMRYVPSTGFPRYRPWKRVINYVTYLAGAFFAGLFVSRHDIVIAATDPPLLSIVGLWLSRVHRAPFVHLMWDVQPEVAISAGLLRSGRLSRILSRLNRYAVRRAACVVAPTEAIRRTVIEFGVPAERAHTISHWEDIDVVQVRPKVSAFSRAHDLADRFVVMYAGNLGLTQELDRYLDLAVRLRDLEDMTLVFVGDGAAKSALQARVAELGLTTVRFLPYERRAQMDYSLAAADVFLAPLAAGLTRFMLPSKIFTILASGRPFIAALDSSSDLRDLVRRSDCGFVVEPGDVAAVEAHIRWLHAHPEECRAMGARGRRAAETVYSRTIVTPQFVDLLRRFETPPAAAASPVS